MMPRSLLVTIAFALTAFAGMTVPAGLRFGPDGYLYVSHNGGLMAGLGSGSVDRYDGTTGALIDSVVTNLTQPAGLLFDSAGNLYVSNFGESSVVVFDGTKTTIF